MPCPNHMTAMHRDACPVCNPRPTQQERDAEDAAKWRALIGSERISVMGSAGLGKPQPDNYAHLTINLWTKHPEPGISAAALADLEKYVEICRRAQSAPTQGTKHD